MQPHRECKNLKNLANTLIFFRVVNVVFLDLGLPLWMGAKVFIAAPSARSEVAGSLGLTTAAGSWTSTAAGVTGMLDLPPLSLTPHSSGWCGCDVLPVTGALLPSHSLR